MLIDIHTGLVVLLPLPFVITSFLNKLHTPCNSYIDSMKLKSSVSQADKT